MEYKKLIENIDINGKSLEFSNGFTDLHTTSYREIIDGNGFYINDTEDCIRNSPKN